MLKISQLTMYVRIYVCMYAAMQWFDITKKSYVESERYHIVMASLSYNEKMIM